MECNVKFEFYRMLYVFLGNQLNVLRLSSYVFILILSNASFHTSNQHL